MFSETMQNSPESRKDTPEELRFKLDSLMDDIAKRVNSEYGQILKIDGSVDMRQWQGRFQGPYSKEDIKEDEKSVWGDKIMFSNSLGLGEDEQKNKIAAFEKRRSETKPALFEKALVGIFDKILRQKFIVARASEFDDYKRSVDTLVINKETGSVVCAFDEVRENGRPVEKIRFDEKGKEIHYKETRTEEKDDRVINKAKQGGARIKYGFSIKDDKLIKTEVRNVPMFRISLSEEELEEFLSGMDCYSDQPTETELEIFDKLIMSLESQIDLLHQEVDVHEKVKENILSFENSLKTIKELRSKF